MFSGDVQCVHCRCTINFSGNVISYQNQLCANHNKEHQFPGMNIIVSKINNNSYFKNIPLTTQRTPSLKPFRHPNILTSMKSTAVASSTNLGTNNRKGFTLYDTKQELIMPRTVPILNISYMGKCGLKIQTFTFKLI